MNRVLIIFTFITVYKDCEFNTCSNRFSLLGYWVLYVRLTPSVSGEISNWRLDLPWSQNYYPSMAFTSPLWVLS